MKNIVLAFLFCVFLIQLNHAQKRYDKWWDEVEELELNGKSKAALEKSEFIFKKAKKQNKEQHLIKAFLYKTKYELILKEEVYQEVVDNFEKEIAEQKTPVQQLLSSIYAESLAKYYQRNRYRISKTASAKKPELFQNWNEDLFLQKIHQYYQKSLNHKENLIAIKDEGWKSFLENGQNYKIYQNSIYDLLVRRYLDFLKNESFTIQPKNVEEFYQNYITDSIYFFASEKFVELEIPDFKSAKILRLYQEVEQPKTKSSSLTKLTYQLDRLEYIYQNSWIDQKEKHYENRLLELKNKTQEKEEQDFISFYLANFYEENANKEKHADYYEKSITEIKNIQKNNTNREITVLAKQLLKTIQNPEVTMKTKKVFQTENSNKALINYQNIDSLYVFVYENIPTEKLLNVRKSDSLINDYITKNKPDQQQGYVLKNPQKHFEFSTEILLPDMKSGKHLIVFSEKNKIKNTTSSLGFHVVQASSIAYAQKNTKKNIRFFVADNQTGKPLADAKIQLFSTDKKQTEKHDLKTDQQGLAKFNPDDSKFSSWKGNIIYKQDTLPLKNLSFYTREMSEENVEEKNLTTKILTDRGIYRPGQKVHFKGFLMLEEKENYHPAEEFSGKIKLYNAKNKAIDSLEFTTNEFGSFSNYFQLPKSALNGRFSLKIETDFEKKSVGEKKRNFNSQRTYFSVEEYKRSKFKVYFSDLEKHYVLGDSIEIKGKAKAFFGGDISYAKVNYTVLQQAGYHRFYEINQYVSIPSFEVKSGVAETDEKGNFEVKFSTENPEIKNLNLSYRIYAEVIDNNGETHDAETIIRLGNPGISAQLIAQNELTIGEEKSVVLKIQDLNQVEVDKKGSFKIYQLERPKRIFRERTWNVPEIQQIPKKEFVKHFPYEIYDSTELKQNWKRKLLTEISTEKATDTLNLDDFSDLISGEYLIQWEENKSVKPLKAEKYISIKNPKKKEEQSHQFLEVNYEVKANSLDLEITAEEEIYLYVNLETETENLYEKVLPIEKGKNSLQLDLPENLKRVKLEYGYFYAADFSLNTEIIEGEKSQENLIFEVKTITDKMTPGEKETWELSVLNQDKTPAEAEILAGMYDLSLDEFVHFKWPENLVEKPYYPYSFSSFSQAYSGVNYGVKNITPYFNKPLLILSKTKLKNFGYDFVSTSSINNQYLQVLKNQRSANSKDAVRGIVSDADGLPLPGANIEVIGKRRYASTDFDGKFAIRAEKGDQLKISSISFEEKIVFVSSKTEVLQVELKENNELQEMVVTSYAAPEKEVQGKTAGLNSAPAPEANDIDQVEEETANLEQASEELDQIQSRENLQETAFFFPNLRTDKNGNVKFSFDSPEALTKWNFQAFAHNKNLQKAYLNVETVTQKELNIIPNFPRFFRTGDYIILKAKITNLNEEKLDGIAQLKFKDEFTGKEIDLVKSTAIQNFKVDAKGNIDVEWELEIPENFTAVRYEIAAKAGNFTDAETSVIPVMTNRELVTETLAFWLNPKENKNFTLEGLKNNTSTSLTHQNLILDYTANPAWTSLQALPEIAKTDFEGSEQVFAKYYVYAVAEKILKENPKIGKMIKDWEKQNSFENKEVLKEFGDEMPWLMSSISLEEQQKELADLLAENNRQTQDYLDELQKMQLKSGGFSWFEGGKENQTISLHILSGLGKIGKPENPELKQKYEQISGKLLTYLDEEFWENQEKKIFSPSAELHYLYARSFFEVKNDSLQTLQHKTFEKLEEDWLKLSLRNKIVLGIAAQRNGKQDVAKKIVESLKENAVINSTQGMYWKENKSSWYWYEAPIETQSLAIELFVQTNQSKENINALKTWLLKQKRVQAWRTTRATTDAIYAILLQGTELVSAENPAKIQIGKENYTVDSKHHPAGYFQVKFDKTEITKDKAKIKIKNQSDSPQYGGMYWQYFEDADKVKASDLSELTIEKQVFVEKYTAEGKEKFPLKKAEVKTGDKLFVKLLVTAKEDFEFMELKDFRASGLEPIEVLSGYQYKNGLRYYQVTKDVATYFFFDRIPKGHYEIEYELRANNSGDFSTGIAELKSVYAPEFSAKTEGKRIEVK